MHGVALIAFDCQDGRILSTFVHGSVGEPDATAVARRRERLAHEVAGQRGDRPFDILEVPLQDLPALGTIDRVDTDKRKLVRRRA
ncbi:MAG: hypothetical protein U1E81_17525 [Xanthobacteraceae bacterium]